MIRINIAMIAALTWMSAVTQPASAQEKRDPAQAGQKNTVVLHVEGMT